MVKTKIIKKDVNKVTFEIIVDDISKNVTFNLSNADNPLTEDINKETAHALENVIQNTVKSKEDLEKLTILSHISNDVPETIKTVIEADNPLDKFLFVDLSIHTTFTSEAHKILEHAVSIKTGCSEDDAISYLNTTYKEAYMVTVDDIQSVYGVEKLYFFQFKCDNMLFDTNNELVF